MPRDTTVRLAGLYAVTPDLVDTSSLVAKVGAAVAGGAAIVQYRNKTAAPGLRVVQARALAQLCRGRALFIVNDDARLAAAVGADGVHVGESDGTLAEVRRDLGTSGLIGVSCYNDLARAQHFAAQGADYLAFGSFHPSNVKPGARRAAPALLARARPLGLPLVAIGGITAANAGALIAAGADAVAVISDLFDHDDAADITRAAAAIIKAINASATTAGTT
jgi:thiamine-phosphate pyrophosphorylase